MIDISQLLSRRLAYAGLAVLVLCAGAAFILLSGDDQPPVAPGDVRPAPTARVLPTLAPSSPATASAASTPDSTGATPFTVTPAAGAAPVIATAGPVAVTPAPSGTPEGVRPAESQTIARYGQRLRSPVPHLGSAATVEWSGWRFPEPPVWGSPHAPFLLHAGDPVEATEPWMTVTARNIIIAFDRYHGTVMLLPPATAGSPLPAELAALMTPEHAASQQAARNAIKSPPAPDWPSYDYGLVVIDLVNRHLVRTYTWTFGAAGGSLDEPYTDHVISEWWRTDEGWLLAQRWSAASVAGENAIAESLILSAGGQFLPYFELVFEARAGLGLPDVLAGQPAGE